MRRRGLIFAPALISASARAQAFPEVDVLLVLAMDASGSIDADEFRLQREGIGESITHPAVLDAIAANPRRAIAIAMTEWGSPGGAALVVDWHRVTNAASAQIFANAVLTAPRSRQSYNAIGDAIAHAAALITAAPYRATERVIDVVGDGPDMRSIIAAPDARDAAVVQGITINGLAIEIAPVTRGNEPLHIHYEGNVMGGPGAFVMVAETRRDFARALRAKMLREIA
jgi:hypothetical protein